MVLIIENIEHIREEWMNVRELRELINDCSELFLEGFGAEFDFSHVKLSDSIDGVSWVDFSWGFSLCFG